MKSEDVIRYLTGLKAVTKTLHVQVKLNSLLLLSDSKSVVGLSQDQDSYAKLVGTHKGLL